MRTNSRSAHFTVYRHRHMNLSGNYNLSRLGAVEKMRNVFRTLLTGYIQAICRLLGYTVEVNSNC